MYVVAYSTQQSVCTHPSGELLFLAKSLIPCN